MLLDTLLYISTTAVPPYCNCIVEYEEVLTTNLDVDGLVVPIPTFPFPTINPKLLVPPDAEKYPPTLVDEDPLFVTAEYTP